MHTLHIVGCGAPAPTKTRFGSAYVVQLDETYLLFDCGPGTTYKLVQMDISPTAIHHLFFTHHHFDHDVDYPCFVLTRWDSGADRLPPLAVYGPPPTERLTAQLFTEAGAFGHDWQARIHHPLSQLAHTDRGGVLPRRPPDVRARDVAPGPVSQGPDWTVTCARAEHVQPWLESLAYRVDYAGGSVVITGDTRPCDTLRELATGADTLVFVVVGIQAEIDGTPLGDAMCGTQGAGILAAEAGAQRLVLVHNRRLAAPGLRERAIVDVARVFAGEIVFGEELLTLPLTLART